MDLDKFLITLHILAAVTWVGGAISLQLVAIQMKRRGPSQLAGFLGDTEFIGQRVFLPASITILATGVWLVARDVFVMDEWVVFGLVVVLLSAAVGAGFLGPESGRIKKLIETVGPEDSETQRRIDRIFVVSRIELTLLVLVVIDMSWKPFAG